MIALTLTPTLVLGSPAGFISGLATSYIPFIDPINAHSWWFLLLFPMAFFISMVYKAVRLGRLDRYWEQVLTMTLVVTLGMIFAGGVFFIVIQWVVPTILPMPD